MTPALVWFRRDLRLSDHPALNLALETHLPIPVFIWAPDEETPWAPGAASRWWLHQSLERLDESLRRRGSRLIIRTGPTRQALLDLAEETGARAIYWNRLYDPAVMERDKELKTSLRERGLTVESFPCNLLFEPLTVRNSSGKPFRVFTAFSKACLSLPAPQPLKDPPAEFPAPSKWPKSQVLSELELEPKIDWTAGIRRGPGLPGESGAWEQVRNFSSPAYSTERDRPDRTGTSRLSPHLHFGEISPRQVWHAVSDSAYRRQLIWREFAHHLLFHNPQTPQDPLRPEFASFPWRMDPKSLQAWTRGNTGYPLVDAGMRELWSTGWMHNRVRMVAASFLVKHLLLPWQEGAAWFWDTLVDADLANNTMGWQWVAGSGADAAPYFRIFNPVIQGERFDPNGDYIRRWIPELAQLPAAWIHQPWNAPETVLSEAGVKLGVTYPLPIVAHEFARERALGRPSPICEKPIPGGKLPSSWRTVHPPPGRERVRTVGS